ncbi:MAG TPA: hypothetical protein VFE16_07330 [Candidatus Cybelea sp.]|jgi:hypothetical protein|nr:hypothetical protein [Candidatus Cybelea sp.]
MKRRKEPVTRRGNGDGSVREREDGRWQYCLRLGSGKRRYYYAATRADLLRRLQDERAKAGGTIRPATRATVREVVEAFLAERKPIEAEEELTAGKRKRTNQERVEIAPSTYEGWEPKSYEHWSGCYLVRAVALIVPCFRLPLLNKRHFSVVTQREASTT